MNITVEVKQKDINGLIDRNLPQALAILAEQIRADSDQFVPRLTGDLRTFVNVRTNMNEAELIYNSRYAVYQWFGVGMKHYTTIGTGPEWCEVARNRYGNDWVRVLSNGILR
jgi:hypothetical protein